MGIFIFKMVLSALIIAFTSWLAGRNPGLSGFIVALPISTLLTLAFTQGEWGDSAKSVELAKSIFYAIPLSLLFFVPFLFSQKLNLSFWQSYISGIVLLGMGYGIHTYIMRFI